MRGGESACVRESGRVHERKRVGVGMRKRGGRWLSECVSVRECVYACVCMRVSGCECVSIRVRVCV